MGRWRGLGIALALTLALAGGAFPTPAEAQTAIQLEEMVVTATRTAQETEKIPARVTVISREEIEASGARNVPEVLRNLAGVFVSDLNGNGQNQTVDMGGFGETANRHVAVTIDGRRINPIDMSGPRWAAIDLVNVERIEVLDGGGSVLYGDQAMGGVINIITRDPEEGLKIRLEAGGGNLDTFKSAVGLNYGTDRTGIILDAVTRSTDGYRDNSASEQSSFAGKFTWRLSDRASGRFQLDYIDAEYEFPGSLTAAEMAQNRCQTLTPDDEESMRATTLSTGMDLDLGAAGRLDFGASFRDEQRGVEMFAIYSDYDLATWTLNAKYVLDHSLAGRENRLTVGVDAAFDDYDKDVGYSPGVFANHFRHSRDTLAGYIQDELSLTGNLVLNLGFRSEQPDTELRADMSGAETVVDKDESEYAWNVGLAYRFMERSKVYARAYRSYRYPLVDEYTTWTGLMNTELEHETSLGYEAGVEVWPLESLKAGLRLFSFDVNDEIAWNDFTYQNENIAETRHQGAEADLRFQPLGFLAFFANAAFTDVEFRSGENSGKTVPLVPEFKAHTGIELQGLDGFTCRVQYNYVGERYFGGDYANAQDKMDDYQTVDLSLRYRWQQAEFFANAINIFNEEYSDYGWYSSWSGASYYPMPEAVYFAGVRLEF